MSTRTQLCLAGANKVLVDIGPRFKKVGAGRSPRSAGVDGGQQPQRDGSCFGARARHCGRNARLVERWLCCRNPRDSFKVWVCYDSSPLIVVPKTCVVHRITLFCAVVSLEHGWVGVPGVGDGDRDVGSRDGCVFGKPDLIDRPAAGKAAAGDEIGDGKKSWQA